MVADWVRDHLPEEISDPEPDRRGSVMTKDETSSWSSTWKRETLGGFLLDLLADTHDDELHLLPAARDEFEKAGRL